MKVDTRFPAKSHATPDRSRRRGAISPGSLVLVAVAIGCSLLVGRRMASAPSDGTINLSENPGVVAGTDTAPESAPSAQDALGAMMVKNLDGQLIPIVTKGEPSIVMVSSVTCSWCKRALKDLGELSAGRPLPRLKLLTLEGAAGGVPMLAKEKIRGAQIIGPAGSSDQVLLTFRYRGTPTFVAIDRNGRVAATMPGYPMREVMKQWYAVMVGDADVP